jgi:hypothetical protein
VTYRVDDIAILPKKKVKSKSAAGRRVASIRVMSYLRRWSRLPAFCSQKSWFYEGMICYTGARLSRRQTAVTIPASRRIKLPARKIHFSEVKIGARAATTAV